MKSVLQPDLREVWNKHARKNLYGSVCSMNKKYSNKEFTMSGFKKVFAISEWIPEKCDLILDYGCGPGRMMKFMSAFCKCIIGIDVSDEMIKSAKTYLTNIKNKILIRQEDAIIGHRFDFAYSCGVFKHIPFENTKSIIIQVMDRLNAGGRFCFSYTSKGDEITTGRGNYPIKHPLDLGYNILYNKNDTMVLEK